MSTQYAVFNCFRFPIQSRWLGDADIGGVVVESGAIIKDLDPEVAEGACRTGCLMLSRDNGRTWEVEPGQIGPNGERAPA